MLFGLTDRLKQFDSKGDPTHIMPIVLFPYTRLLNRYGFSVLESWGFPEDGSSPTSSPLMSLVARLLRPIVRTPIAHGDTLCLLIKRNDSSLASDPNAALKVSLLTSHY